VPTAREQGIDAFQPSYAALWATRGTPEPILDRLQEACHGAARRSGWWTDPYTGQDLTYAYEPIQPGGKTF
jgi:tripartite-type tricarboxylate transporter receptor subunit TctC